MQDVLRLPNGNTLVACGTKARILEITPDKKIVWQLVRDDYPELNLSNACGLNFSKTVQF
ncbi:MAG: arylsulfotransferase family protein [Lentisphaerales bacterium]|nr:arylsulfotransferase family protein [Lentisphaerales bacterium]